MLIIHRFAVSNTLHSTNILNFTLITIHSGIGDLSCSYSDPTTHCMALVALSNLGIRLSESLILHYKPSTMPTLFLSSAEMLPGWTLVLLTIYLVHDPSIWNGATHIKIYL